MATHASVLAWNISWAEEFQSLGHNRAHGTPTVQCLAQKIEQTYDLSNFHMYSVMKSKHSFSKYRQVFGEIRKH